MAIYNKDGANLKATGKCLQCGAPTEVYWDAPNNSAIELCGKCVITVCGALIGDSISIAPRNSSYTMDKLLIRIWSVVAGRRYEERLCASKRESFPG